MFDAIDERMLLNQNGIQVYGVGTSEDDGSFIGLHNIWNDYTV